MFLRKHALSCCATIEEVQGESTGERHSSVLIRLGLGLLSSAYHLFVEFLPALLLITIKFSTACSTMMSIWIISRAQEVRLLLGWPRSKLEISWNTCDLFCEKMLASKCCFRATPVLFCEYTQGNAHRLRRKWWRMEHFMFSDFQTSATSICYFCDQEKPA